MIVVSRWVRIARVACVLWFVAMTVLGAALLAKHAVALPVPARSQQLSSSFAPLRAAGKATWLAVHVLYAECRCSERVLAHLTSSQRPNDWQELVLWVGGSGPLPHLSPHFRLLAVTSTTLAKMGVDAAPLLVVLDPNDAVRYVGGYTDHKQGPTLNDLQILSDVQHGEPVASLPLFGCAVSERLKHELSILPGL